MLEILKSFLWDPTAFRRYTRAGLALVWSLYTMGLLPEALLGKTGWYLAQLMPVIAFLINAGDKNQTPEEIKTIAQDK